MQAIKPFISQEPRPKSLSPLIVALKGSVDQLFETGTTSVCPDKITDLNNMIFYGPSGTGKYSQVLYSIQKYSPTNLKYERKININLQKKTHYSFQISDIHFEIDMSLLGCNARIVWNEIYHHILDILSTRTGHSGIIVCKNFHNIHAYILLLQQNNIYYYRKFF